MEFDQLVKAFGERNGMSDFAPDAHGAVTLEVDGIGVLVSRVPDADIAVAVGDLGAAPLFGGDSLNRILLQANLSFGTLAGVSFAINPEDKAYRLVARTDIARMEPDGFAAWLDDFADKLVQWREFVETYRDAEDDAVAEGDDDENGGAPDESLAHHIIKA